MALLVEVSNLRIAEAQAYNASLEFSSTKNPNGPWSYGWTQTNGSALNLLPIATTIVGTELGNPVTTSAALNVWTSNCCGTLQPLVFHNPTVYTIQSQTATIPTDSGDPWSTAYGISGLGLHPGPDGQNAVVRWTAPAGGYYNVRATFRGLDYIGTTTNVAVYRNSTELFAANVIGYAGYYCVGTLRSSCLEGSPVQVYSGIVELCKGDKLDFAVGYGTNGYGYDSTGLDVSIRAWPITPPAL
jgi:hypothetical protein